MLRAAALLLAVLAGGCGGGTGGDEPDPATGARLAEVRAQAQRAGRPVHWLGESFRGQRVDAIESRRGFVTFFYGEPSCDWLEGCLWPIELSSGAPRNPTGSACRERLGPAILAGCEGDEDLQVLSGPVNVLIRNEGDPQAFAMARGLRRFDDEDAPRFLRPTRFSCREMAQAVVGGSVAGPARLRRDC